jgi:uncharacterized Zn-binding protein involved in type VI secretion
MASVTVNAPKTPVTEGSNGIAQNTVPNVCKMPGPPAPFVPTPLPNIGKSGMSPQGYSTTVKIEGSAVAIQGSSFGSMGDVASKAQGGGLVSMNCEGPTKFIGPGSFDVKIEGKNVQYLGDPMMNNCGPSGSPPNAATMVGEDQKSGGKSCAHQIKLVERNPDDKINKHKATAEQKQAAVEEAKEAQAKAESAVANPPKGSQRGTLRQLAERAAKRVKKAEADLAGANRNVKSAEQEKQVVKEIKGKCYDFECSLCGEKLGDIGDIDAANNDVVKEVKGSAAGYNPDQFAKIKDIANQLLGAGVKVHMAVPHSQVAALEADPSLAGKVQGHAI